MLRVEYYEDNSWKIVTWSGLRACFVVSNSDKVPGLLGLAQSIARGSGHEVYRVVVDDIVMIIKGA